jgi:hypothetical protein
MRLPITKLPRRAVVMLLVCCSSFALAQDSPGHFEIGANFTSVRNFRLPGTVGVGLESDLNLGRHFALDAAVDWLPAKSIEGNTVIGLFGVKAGVRRERFGYFAKVRPGFLTIDDVFRSSLLSQVPSFINIRFNRLTEPALDLGGVVEYYPARHWALRWDLSDMLVLRQEGPTFTAILEGQPPFVTNTPSTTTNNFRFSTSLHYRF